MVRRSVARTGALQYAPLVSIADLANFVNLFDVHDHIGLAQAFYVRFPKVPNRGGEEGAIVVEC